MKSLAVKDERLVIVALLRLHGLRNWEIAEQMGLPPEVVKRSIRRDKCAAVGVRWVPHPLGAGPNTRRGAEHYAWKGDAASDTSKCDRCRRLYPDLQPCEECGGIQGVDRAQVDRHHIDGDPGNNHPSNIAFLCRYCHVEIDGRLGKWMRSRPPVEITPPKECKVCGELAKPLRRGRCHACAEYLRRTGVERSEYLARPLATHCVHGHEWNEANSYVSPAGERYCRKCHAASNRRRRYPRTVTPPPTPRENR